MVPVYELSTREGRAGLDARLQRLRQSLSTSGEYARIAAEVIEGVRRDGDVEIVRQMRQWTDPEFTAGRIAVTADELDAAAGRLTGPLRRAIETAIDHVRLYQRHILPPDPQAVSIGGAELGLRFVPVDSVGLNVPGGSAVLFSTLIMLAVPAQVAGVAPASIAVASPPPTRKARQMVGQAEGQSVGDISPIVLVVCRMLGIERVYRMGGPAAFAALALGTTTVKPVDMIAGPSHPIGQVAKMLLAGTVGIDGFYGASEVTTLADGTANPAYIAADMIAQAEHDPGKCFLVAWSRDVVDKVVAQIGRQLADQPRRAAIEAGLGEASCAVLVGDEAQAAEVANRIACEHVNLAVADPKAWLSRIRHAGEIFLGDQTPVAAGDYYAGPSHTLPTGTTARFASGVSAYTFLKRTGTIHYPQGLPPDAIDAIAAMARAEGLEAHAQSVLIRRR